LTIAHFVTVAKSIGPYALHGWIIVDSFITYVGVHLGISTGGVALGAVHGAGAVASAESVLSASSNLQRSRTSATLVSPSFSVELPPNSSRSCRSSPPDV